MRLMTEMFGTSATLASKLWKAFDVSALLFFQISQCDRPGNVPHEVLMGRFDSLCQLVTPAALLEASLLVSPETGRPRSRESIRFEQAVLLRTDACGRWK